MTLTMEEQKLLSETPTEATQVKNAFLFSCLTGLRWIDVKNLMWQNIDGDVIRRCGPRPIRVVLMPGNHSRVPGGLVEDLIVPETHASKTKQLRNRNRQPAREDQVVEDRIHEPRAQEMKNGWGAASAPSVRSTIHPNHSRCRLHRTRTPSPGPVRKARLYPARPI